MKRNNLNIEDSLIIKAVFELLLKTIERLKNNKTSISSEYFEEIRECIIWTLNILNEIVSESNELTGKSEEIIEYKKKEYTVIIFYLDNLRQLHSNNFQSNLYHADL